MFWSLDPDFPSPSVLASLDFDAILTNSLEVMGTFKDLGVTTAFNELGVDGGLFKPDPNVSTAEKTDIVFVGSGGAILSGSKRFLKDVLLEAIDTAKTLPNARVVIYGSSWGDIPEFSPYWGGVLPQSSLPSVYSSAMLVLGCTMDAQRDAGMVNNRVYEVLAAGTPFLTERFQGVEGVCEGVCWFYKEEDVRGTVKESIVEIYKTGVKEREERGERGREIVVEGFGYGERLRKFVDIYHELGEGGKNRVGKPKLLFVTEVGWWGWGGWASIDYIKGDYDVTVKNVEEVGGEGWWLGWAMIVGVGRGGGEVDMLMMNKVRVGGGMGGRSGGELSEGSA